VAGTGQKQAQVTATHPPSMACGWPPGITSVLDCSRSHRWICQFGVIIRKLSCSDASAHRGGMLSMGLSVAPSSIHRGAVLNAFINDIVDPSDFVPSNSHTSSGHRRHKCRRDLGPHHDASAIVTKLQPATMLGLHSNSRALLRRPPHVRHFSTYNHSAVSA